LLVDGARLVELLKRSFAAGTIMDEHLDVKETSVGRKADLPQGREISQPFADGEIAWVVPLMLLARKLTAINVNYAVSLRLVHYRPANDGKRSGFLQSRFWASDRAGFVQCTVDAQLPAHEPVANLRSCGRRRERHRAAKSATL